VTLVGSIDGCTASHVCPTRRGIRLSGGLSAWEVCGAAPWPPAD